MTIEDDSTIRYEMKQNIIQNTKNTLLVIFKSAFASFTCFFLFGCNNALNMHVYEPIANAGLVTIEVVNVNNETCPGNSLQNAVSKFDEYVLGDVRIINAEPVQLDLGSDGALSKKQFDEIISKNSYSGQSTINLVVAPDYEYSKNRGVYSWQKNNDNIRNTISLNARNCNKTASWIPFVSREEYWRFVILHELCHSLNVPAGKSHVQQDRHCTNPDCILYRKIDIFSIIAAILNSGPPKGLCKQCEAEIRQVHSLAKGTFYNDSKTFNRFGGLIELNPGNLEAVATAAFYEFVHDNKAEAIKNFNTLLAGKPKYKYTEVNDGVSAYTLRGICYRNTWELEKASADFRKAIEMIPEDWAALQTYAEILCASKDERLRNGPQAVLLATQACRLKGWKDPMSIDILACAYAECGDFESAIKYEQQAIDLLEQPSDKLEKCLELFRKNIPYRREQMKASGGNGSDN